MLGTDKSRGYCLEMICADFLAGASLEGGNPEILVRFVMTVFNFLRDPGASLAQRCALGKRASGGGRPAVDLSGRHGD
jgi:hypothetical protein